ncbi:MAG TPA: transporter associated domain-containing protein [Wenzhouxiangella sp.]|nr:transporter associated domain-containing protein [Wenzhouxiangella sp.]
MSRDSEDNGNDSVPGWIERLGRAFGGEPRSREGLIEVMRDMSEQALIEPYTLAMLEGALKVSEQQVRDVMIPRSRMIVVRSGSSLDEILPVVIESGHSRFPVVGEDRDEIKGILLAKDLLRLFANDADIRLSDLPRPPIFIPETKRLNILLREFRVSKNHMAIVVDEYGGVSGLITIEDVLERIVGDIDDEHDPIEVQDIRPLDGNRYAVQALTHIEDFNDKFDTEFAGDEYDTIGGLVIAEFGRLPEPGETVQIDKWRFKVTSADDRRLRVVEVSPA